MNPIARDIQHKRILRYAKHSNNDHHSLAISVHTPLPSKRAVTHVTSLSISPKTTGVVPSPDYPSSHWYHSLLMEPMVELVYQLKLMVNLCAVGCVSGRWIIVVNSLSQLSRSQLSRSQLSKAPQNQQETTKEDVPPTTAALRLLVVKKRGSRRSFYGKSV